MTEEQRKAKIEVIASEWVRLRQIILDPQASAEKISDAHDRLETLQEEMGQAIQPVISDDRREQWLKGIEKNIQTNRAIESETGELLR